MQAETNDSNTHQAMDGYCDLVNCIISPQISAVTSPGPSAEISNMVWTPSATGFQTCRRNVHASRDFSRKNHHPAGILHKMDYVVLVLILILVFVLAVSLLYEYASWKTQHVCVSIAVLLAWYISFLFIFIIPIDVSTVSTPISYPQLSSVVLIRYSHNGLSARQRNRQDYFPSGASFRCGKLTACATWRSGLDCFPKWRKSLCCWLEVCATCINFSGFRLYISTA